MKNLPTPKLVLIAFLALSAGCASSPARAADCAGCDTLRALERELNSVAPNDFDRMGKLIDSASDAVDKVPRARGRWDADQIRELVQLMIADTHSDPDNQLVQNNWKAFSRQETAFLAEIGRLESERRIDAALSERLKVMLLVGIDEAKRDEGR